MFIPLYRSEPGTPWESLANCANWLFCGDRRTYQIVPSRDPSEIRAVPVAHKPPLQILATNIAAALIGPALYLMALLASKQTLSLKNLRARDLSCMATTTTLLPLIALLIKYFDTRNATVIALDPKETIQCTDKGLLRQFEAYFTAHGANIHQKLDNDDSIVWNDKEHTSFYFSKLYLHDVDYAIYPDSSPEQKGLGVDVRMARWHEIETCRLLEGADKIALPKTQFRTDTFDNTTHSYLIELHEYPSDWCEEHGDALEQLVSLVQVHSLGVMDPSAIIPLDGGKIQIVNCAPIRRLETWEDPIDYLLSILPIKAGPLSEKLRALVGKDRVNQLLALREFYMDRGIDNHSSCNIDLDIVDTIENISTTSITYESFKKILTWINGQFSKRREDDEYFYLPLHKSREISFVPGEQGCPEEPNLDTLLQALRAKEKIFNFSMKWTNGRKRYTIQM